MSGGNLLNHTARQFPDAYGAAEPYLTQEVRDALNNCEGYPVVFNTQGRNEIMDCTPETRNCPPATAGGALAKARLGSSANPGKPLERLSLAVGRVNAAAMRICGFAHRFHGVIGIRKRASPNVASASVAGGDQGISPYGLDLESLFDAIDRLETHVDALEAIG